MKQKKQKKNYQKVMSRTMENVVLRVARVDEGGLEYLISKYPKGWVEWDIENQSEELVELQKINFPIKGNHFCIELTRDDVAAKVACSKMLTELYCRFSLRLFSCPSANMYFVATDAGVETVETLFEYILNHYGIGK